MDSEQSGQLVSSKYSNKFFLKSILGQDGTGLAFIGQRVVVGGWVKASREYRRENSRSSAGPQPQVPAGEPKLGGGTSHSPCLGSIRKALGQLTRVKLNSIFDNPPTQSAAKREPSIVVLEISDGSCIDHLQVSVESSLVSPGKIMPVGTCIMAEGILQLPSIKQGRHRIELKADKFLHVGRVDQVKYPIPKKQMSYQVLRDCPHIRHRKKKVERVMVIRNVVAQATHTFFRENDFLHVEAPIITSTDCEGVGKTDMFQVATISAKGITRSQSTTDEIKNVIERTRSAIKEKQKTVDSSSKQAAKEIDKDRDLVLQLEAPARTDDKYRLSKNFFSRETFLTVSGLPHLESYACAFANVYSFGPRFRVTQNEPEKLLSEAWMVDLQMAFVEIEGAMECAMDFLMFICRSILEDCIGDIQFLSSKTGDSSKAIVDRLQLIVDGKFKKISYYDAFHFLTDEFNEKKFDINWGDSLSEEHESYLTDEVYKMPVIIYNHPKDTRPFYMRLNNDEASVASFDVIVPKVGALIRGSQNEERYDILTTRIKDLQLANDQYKWYLDVLKYGGAPCSGFTVLFDALVLYATGLRDARDAVPFPRSPGNAYA